MKQYAYNKDINIIIDADFEDKGKGGLNLIKKDISHNLDSKGDVALTNDQFIERIKGNLKYHVENEVNHPFFEHFAIINRKTVLQRNAYGDCARLQ